jgi:hypothetical protein
VPLRSAAQQLRNTHTTPPATARNKGPHPLGWGWGPVASRRQRRKEETKLLLKEWFLIRAGESA